MKSIGFAPRVVIFLVAIVALSVLRYRPWTRPNAPSGPPGATSNRETLVVGYLPVT